jgi:hypothetical protein
MKKPYETTHPQKLYKFDNGFGASVVSNPISYGGSKGQSELAVLRFDGDSYKITYDTSITSDVIGYLEQSEVDELLERIEKLQPHIVIKGGRDDDYEPLFWSNEDGWVDVMSATRFTEQDSKSLQLPISDDDDYPAQWVHIGVEYN